MNAIAEKLSPNATDMIRRDHSKVLAAFHRYDAAARPQARQALVNTLCLALEVHAQIEEEIFYPAMRGTEPQAVDKGIPEHDEMRRLMGELRAMDPENADYGPRFMALMRTVIHHVADEETTLLPQAERMLAGRLGELGGQMLRRRLQLMAPRAGEVARNSAGAMSKNTLLMGAGALLAGLFVLRRVRRL
jgi:hemerythrin superfamily protein